MNPLQTWLKEADPLASEPPLSDTDVTRMRRVVMAGADNQERSLGDWRRMVLRAAMTAAIAVLVLAGLTSGARRLTSEARRLVPVARVELTDITSQPVTRQLQFATPGGTRVIWFFNPEFQQ